MLSARIKYIQVVIFIDKKEIEKLINSLDQEQKSKLMNALANKSEAERILRTPEAQAIMKKLKGEK